MLVTVTELLPLVTTHCKVAVNDPVLLFAYVIDTVGVWLVEPDKLAPAGFEVKLQL